MAEDDPVPVKFWRPSRKDACFTFHMRSAVQSALALAGLFVLLFKIHKAKKSAEESVSGDPECIEIYRFEEIHTKPQSDSV